MAYCTNCGQELRSTDRFCPNCGCSLNGNMVSDEKPKKKGIPWWGVLIIIVVSFFLLLIVGFIVLTFVAASKAPKDIDYYYNEIDNIQDIANEMTYGENYDYYGTISMMSSGITAAENLVGTIEQYETMDGFDSPLESTYKEDVRDSQMQVAKKVSEYNKSSTDTKLKESLNDLYEDYLDATDEALKYTGGSTKAFDDEAKDFYEEYDEFIKNIE